MACYFVVVEELQVSACYQHSFSFATMTVPLDVLRESIVKHNGTFESLLNIIPARFYISKDPDEAEVNANCEFVHLLHCAHSRSYYQTFKDIVQVYEE